MRSSRRRILNIAGTIFLAVLLTRIVYLITGLRTYATRPEIPFRLIEMLIVLLSAAFTYFFSYRFGFLPMAAASVLSLYAPTRELVSGSHFTIGAVSSQLNTDDYIFDILLIVGALLLIVLSVLINPKIPRNHSMRHIIRLLASAEMLVFAARMVWNIVTLAGTLMAETYPGQYITKYYYVIAATDFALILVGIACLMTAGIRPSDHHHREGEASEHPHSRDDLDVVR